MSDKFVLDETAARALLAEIYDEESPNYDPPMLLLDGPGQAIEELYSRVWDAVRCPPGFEARDVAIYPLRYEMDPDGVLIVLHRPYPLPGLASQSMEWDDIAPREALERDLTADEAIGVVNEVLRYANELAAHDHQRHAQGFVEAAAAAFALAEGGSNDDEIAALRAAVEAAAAALGVEIPEEGDT